MNTLSTNCRARLRAEFDVWYAHVHDLSRDGLRYILNPKSVISEGYPSETFRVLKQNELREHGEYRTERLVLEAWRTLNADQLQSESPC